MSAPADLDALAGRVGGTLDGVLHAIGFAPESCLGGGFLTAPWEDVAVALQISAYSLKSLAVACRPLMTERRQHRRARLRQQPRRVAGLRLDGRRQGRARVDRALPRARPRRRRHPRQPRRRRARSAPSRREASPGSSSSRTRGATRAPLGWDVKDASPVASACVALLSDLFPATTGEIVHVDGGYHAIGA